MLTQVSKLTKASAMLKVFPYSFKITMFALLFALLVGCGTPEPVNESPILSTIAAQTGFQDEQITIPFSITDESPNSLSFTASSSDQTLLPDSAIQVTGSGSERQLVISPASGIGTTGISLTVTDNEGQSDDLSFNLNMQATLQNF